MRIAFLSSLFLMIGPHLLAQSQNYSQNDDFHRHLIDRVDILNDGHNHFTSFKALQRHEVSNSAITNGASQVDKFNQDYLAIDNWEYADSAAYQSKKALWNKFYRSKSDFFHFKNEDLDFHFSPIFGFLGGIDSQTDELIYTNTRGAEIRGSIDNKVFFYTAFTENQLRYPSYVREFQGNFQVIPGLGFWKLLGDNAYDFIQARGHVSVQATKHINVQLGHDRFFIGNGYRSMLLSDFSNFYPYVKVKTKVWKLQYTNLYTQLIADVNSSPTGTFGTGSFPQKFMTMHHLSINFSDNFNLGLFESIIFSREDSLGNNAFEFNYLNPIILYRSVEQFTGSPDNALLGLDFKWNMFNRFSWYGQFLVDEFLVKQVTGEKGDWRNKFSVQLGGKYINAFGIDNLDLQLEYNLSRPYTYTHESFYTNYTHYDQPLAHPLGANFREFIGIVRYQPIPRLFITGKVITSEHGRDPVGDPVGVDANFGGDIDKPYTNRTPGDLSNFIGQGVNVKLIHADLMASYMLKHNLFIDLRQVFRDRTSDEAALSGSLSYTSLGLRLNLASRENAF